MKSFAQNLLLILVYKYHKTLALINQNYFENDLEV